MPTQTALKPVCIQNQVKKDGEKKISGEKAHWQHLQTHMRVRSLGLDYDLQEATLRTALLHMTHKRGHSSNPLQLAT